MYCCAVWVIKKYFVVDVGANNVFFNIALLLAILTVTNYTEITKTYSFSFDHIIIQNK